MYMWASKSPSAGHRREEAGRSSRREAPGKKGISLLSLQKQPRTAPSLFQREVEYGKYEEGRRRLRARRAPPGDPALARYHDDICM